MSESLTIRDVCLAYLHWHQTPVAKLNELLVQFEILAKSHPDLDFWAEFEEVLKYSWKVFEPDKGTFGALLLRNLRQRLNRETARNAKRRIREGRAKRKWKVREKRRRRASEQVKRKRRWWQYVLNAALAYVDNETLAYIQIARQTKDPHEVADRLCMDIQMVNNRWGGDRLSRKVRRAISRLMRTVQPQQRLLLCRHLCEKADMDTADVKQFLGVRIRYDERVPLLEEDELLQELGWTKTIFRKSDIRERNREYLK